MAPAGKADSGFARLPTGGQAGTGAVKHGLVLLIDVELSDKLNLEAQLASKVNYDREQDRRHLKMTPPVALEYDFTRKPGLITEAVAWWNTQQRRWQTTVNVAPIIKVNDNLRLDFGTYLVLKCLSDRKYFVGFTIRR